MTPVSLDVYDSTGSASNSVVKLMRSLRRRKDRRSSGVFLVSGVQLVREAVEQRWQIRHALICRRRSGEAVREVAGLVHAAGGRVLVVSSSLLEGVTGDDGRQSMAAAVVERRWGLSDLATRGSRRYLACYEIRDPGNLGSLLRTAYAALFDGVILIGRCCDPFCGVSVRASMGAIFALRVVRATMEEFVEWKNGIGASVSGAVIGGDCGLDRLRGGQRSVLLLGNERSGLPDDLEEICDQRVHLPMRSGFHSLNVAAAGAVMIYSLWRGSGYAGGD